MIINNSYPKYLIVHLLNDLVSSVHSEISVNVRIQTKSSEMMERDGEPLERIVKMRKRTISFFPFFKTQNLPGIPLEFLLW